MRLSEGPVRLSEGLMRLLEDPVSPQRALQALRGAYVSPPEGTMMLSEGLSGSQRALSGS